jgi:hypothetical protein
LVLTALSVLTGLLEHCYFCLHISRYHVRVCVLYAFSFFSLFFLSYLFSLYSMYFQSSLVNNDKNVNTTKRRHYKTFNNKT